MWTRKACKFAIRRVTTFSFYLLLLRDLGRRAEPGQALSHVFSLPFQNFL